MPYIRLTRSFVTLSLSVAALILGHAPPGQAADLPSPLQAGAAEVVDADGLRLQGVVIRLHGIDAPEHDQTCQNAEGAIWRCGETATDRLAQMIADTMVTCRELDRDRYDRSVARCEAAGVDLAEAMVAEGLAWAYLRYSDTYAPVETVARQQGFGIWSGVNQPAWEYRAIRRADTSDAPECRIKGNISQSGDRIYHLPDSRSYAATRISEAKGERWFCSEEEARTAGWRAPRG
ncbi:thermonuclease family protein [Paracoccus hibiscisoli]|uniref:Thermonuclease family protein n=1 Tax=Paracoccus hibiscisoli TaxID=2023261 RepID=A0A4U0QU12_9RHOB|nr:thermonuclease family protein [Paracoccus hibiscisoli]TJZ85601.1 thermonuclease family protein [Paracoccus hibiscisoli]